MLYVYIHDTNCAKVAEHFLPTYLFLLALSQIDVMLMLFNMSHKVTVKIILITIDLLSHI